MNKQRGFTLLEIILALVIFASCAMMVVSTIPSRSGADIFGQQLKALVDYGSDRAVMDGNIVGLVITADKYQLVTLDAKSAEQRWVPLTAGRITTKGDFPEEMHVSLSPQRLAATIDADPQIVFLPDGEIGRFTLSLQSYDKQHRFRVVSQGAAPVSVENDD
ncbi:type II secretion system protein GspH [Enterobacter cancerogenus]|uniref:Type II secretion system protein H n=1 Tax=Enterobacter cancerogenus TaxID=69218 RepID=A0AB38P8I8_9ENTR|nr:type II secretion system minor pseudopilin GspH [Enterobacter cancerogenus]TKK23151.1 type II secretion system protein GspH [Enterobacter cancerogenus]